MVEQLTNKPKIEGSNPASDTAIEKMVNKKNIWLCSSRTVVEQTTKKSKIEGSNL